MNETRVRDLIGFLLNFDLDLPVLVTWESVTREISKDNIYEGNPGVRNPFSSCFGKYLLIDADENSYKEEFQSGLLKLDSPVKEDLD